MPSMHEQLNKNTDVPQSFLSYPESKRLELEASIRNKRTTGEDLTEEEQIFYDAEHEFLTEGDKIH